MPRWNRFGTTGLALSSMLTGLLLMVSAGSLTGLLNCSRAHLPPTSPSDIPTTEGADVLPPKFPLSLLEESWKAYKKKFIQSDGRVIDHKGGNVSTSEGQAYAMLRAVWMRDRETFDSVWRWAVNNLNSQVRSDRLFAWKWGLRPDNTWGILDVNCATDADQLIAFSLFRAAERFAEPHYAEAAQALLPDLWSKTTLEVHGTRYSLAGDWRPPTGPLPLNPSYQMPFVYRTFAANDQNHAWKRVVDSSYKVLESCRSAVGLPADWCHLDRETGKLSLDLSPESRFSDFGYEAFRVYWNLAASSQWDSDARALKLLQEMDWLTTFWRVRKELPAVITASGVPRETFKSPGMYGAFMPALALTTPGLVAPLYESGIAPLYQAGLWNEAQDYYIQNWVWFGVALLSDRPSP